MAHFRLREGNKQVMPKHYLFFKIDDDEVDKTLFMVQRVRSLFHLRIGLGIVSCTHSISDSLN